MSILLSLSTLAIREVVDGACVYAGIEKNGAAVVGFLTERFTDHSQRLTKALHSANEKAWKALEIALAGDSFWDRCKVLIARSEDKAFAQQVRAFLDAAPLRELAGKKAFRQKCLEELHAARKEGALTKGSLDHQQLAKQAGGDFARFGDPAGLVDAEWRMIAGIASEMKEAGYGSLARLLSRRPAQEMPVLVIAVRYFFRRAVEDDQKLFQGLAFAKLEALGEAQEKGFAALSGAFAQQGQRLEDLLGDVKAVVVETHSAVLDLQGQVKGLSEETRQMFQAVMKQLEQHQLQGRELRPSDSLSIRGDAERQLVKQLVSRYRALPEEQREKTPALLNAIGKLEVVAGDFDAAQKDFQQVATLVTDTAAKAEAHFNAYGTALERRDFTTALKELMSAVKLDAKRFAPFPVGKYHPQSILGAGGFGVAFSCRHKELKADVVIKTLTSDDLARDVDEVFNEARVLDQLDHPAIIRLRDCGYTIPAEKARPYFVMNFFESVTLEEYVQKHGPMSQEDMIVVARQLAEGLQAAHSKGILHRDVKPANILVRKDDSGWQVKVIDFGLALKHQVIEGAVSTSKQNRTLLGSTIAGTLDYGAPEQMGRLPGVAVGPSSDVYGWAKTCCFGLFKTTQPLMKHWQSISPPLAKLLEECLAENPQERPTSFNKVLQRLGTKASAKTRDAGRARPVAARPSKKWLLAGVAVALLGIIGLFAGVSFLLNRQAAEINKDAEQVGKEIVASTLAKKKADAEALAKQQAAEAAAKKMADAEALAKQQTAETAAKKKADAEALAKQQAAEAAAKKMADAEALAKQQAAEAAAKKMADAEALAKQQTAETAAKKKADAEALAKQQAAEAAAKKKGATQRVTRENFAKLKVGMTLKQLEDILGAGELAVAKDATELASSVSDEPGDRTLSSQTGAVWSVAVNERKVYAWKHDNTIILAGFFGDPRAGSKVQAVYCMYPKYSDGSGYASQQIGSLLKATRENFANLTVGMTLGQLQEPLGVGRRATTKDLDGTNLRNDISNNTNWTQSVANGRVHIWQEGPVRILAAFPGVPAAGSKVEVLFSSHDGAQKPADKWSVSKEDFARLKVGMTLKELEEILGAGRLAIAEDEWRHHLFSMTNQGKARKGAWTRAIKQERVQLWHGDWNSILAAFPDAPSVGGKVEVLYFSYSRWDSNNVRLNSEVTQKPADKWMVSKENFAKLKVGMTLKELEDVLGMGTPTVSLGSYWFVDKDLTNAWAKAAKERRVYSWGPANNISIVAGFSEAPSAATKVEALVSSDGVKKGSLSKSK